MGRDSANIVTEIDLRLDALLVIKPLSPNSFPEGCRNLRHASWIRSGINVHRGAESVEPLAGRREQEFKGGDGVMGPAKGWGPNVRGLSLHPPLLKKPIGLRPKLIHRETREGGMFV